MKWLVTFNRQGRDKVVERLQSLGCAVLNLDRPVRLDADEDVLTVEGPSNLVQLAQTNDVAMKIYPNSKMSTY